MSAKIGMKLYTRASMEITPGDRKKFLNRPEAVEHYGMWMLYLGQVAKIYVNTTDRYLVKEIHEAFLQMMKVRENLTGAVNCLARESKYSAMKCPTDEAVPLIDSMPKSERVIKKTTPSSGHNPGRCGSFQW